MTTEPVTFGSKRALKIVSSELAEQIKTAVEEKLGSKITDKNYVLLNETTISKIQKSSLVSYNTLGQRYLLFLTIVNAKKYCVFINRKNGMMIIVRFRFAERFFSENTVFDGELIKMTNGSWVFLISSPFNCEIIDDPTCFQSDENVDVCMLLGKRWFDLSKLAALEDPSGYRSKLPYASAITGLVFSEEGADVKIVYIFQDCRKATQKTEKKAVDTNVGTGASAGAGSGASSANGTDPVFKIVETDLPDVYELFTKTGSKSIGYAAIPDLQTSEFVCELFENKTQNDIFVKCRFNEKFEKWVPFAIA